MPPSGYRWSLWKPSGISIAPRGFPLFPFAIWSAFHYLHVFFNRDYQLLLIHHGAQLVHRSVITPGYFRFPFMHRDDLQVGDTWTDDGHRGKGLATFALKQIASLDVCVGRSLWYLVEEANTSSMRVAEKAGFSCVARGTRGSRFGLRLFGAFHIDERFQPRC
ncbi:MAG: hypothetical protein JNK87_07115 [Bryobacterales bacterium]|nr:hypothetical protein [Bryobacterales bacterium]